MNFKINKNGGWIVPAGSNITESIPNYSQIGDDCEIGDDCKIGDACIFGDDCKIGDACEIGNRCEIGDGCIFGDGCEIASIKTVKLMTLSNVDGSGRQIKLIFDGKKIHVEAGCFFGNVNDFCEKAESEGKYFYSKILRTNALVMLDYYGSTTTDR